MNYLINIENTVGEPSVNELGGKGASLVKLAQGGFPVPEGFIITTDGYRAFVNKLHLNEKYATLHEKVDFTLEDAESISNEIKDLFSISPFPEEYANEMQEFIQKLRDNALFDINLVAIRSSATTEDLGDASFAGMHDTILNVPINKEDIEKAVIQCWASLYTPRAILYRYEKKFPIIDTSIAVVVQRMIPSEKSGVIFSCDPQTSSREHISLDGVIGLGEALVSGMVSTDHWSIRKHYPVAKDTTELRIVESTINTQEFALFTKKEGGTEKRELGEEGKKACFTEEEIYKISQYAVDIEKYYQKPMDMEFCIYKDKMYIVQARPITTLIELPPEMDPLSPLFDSKFRCCASFNYIQMLVDPIDYLSFSLNNHSDVNSYYYNKYIGGYPYTDMSPLLKSSSWRNGMIATYQNMFDKEIGNSIQEWYTSDFAYYEDTVSNVAFNAYMKTIYPDFFKILFKYYLFGYNGDKIEKEAFDRFNQVMNMFNDYIDREEKGEKPLTLKEIYDIPFNSIYILHNLAPFFMIFSLCENKVKNILTKNKMDISLEEKMCGGRKENLASQMDYQISQLHLLMLRCNEDDKKFIEHIQNLFVEDDMDEDEGELKSYIASLKESTYKSHQDFYTQYMAFMKVFGRRGPGEIAIIKPRYENKPSILLKTVLNTSFEGVEHRSPEALEQEADRVVEEVCSKLSRRDTSNLRYYLKPARLSFTFREHNKYFTISHYYLYRRKVLEYAKDLKEKNLIKDIHDIFHFSIEELLQIDEGTIDYTTVIPAIYKRKAIYEKGFITPPPRLIVSPYAAFVNVSEQTKQELLNLPENILKGMPTSAGIVEGRAVVVTDPREGHLQKGDILVAQATDPGWTPLFVPSAAVVIAIGGPLTHGSIVAREMGIPCVVNVQNLMEKVKTGMRIKVDGSKGTVEILDESVPTNE
ncbi:hypothetical protein WA158_001450 [Blastocystis sp. Blastoise]